MAPKETLLSFQSHTSFHTTYVALVKHSLLIGLQSYWGNFWYWSTSWPEKNCKGQFCLKTNYFANPSFLKVGRNGDPTSNCSKPVRVLTRTKSSYTLDHPSIDYLLPDFQTIWSNFKIEIFQLQLALKPYEFWLARRARVAMIPCS